MKDVLCNNADEESKSILHMIRIAFYVIECNRITFTKAITCCMIKILKLIIASSTKKKRKENRLDVLRRIVEDYWKYVRK